MWMWPIAAMNVVASRRWRVVGGGTDIAAAVLNETSCSVMRTGVGLCCVEPTADGADPTSDVSVDAVVEFDICGYLPTGGGLAIFGMPDAHLDQLFREKHQETPKTSSKWMRSSYSS
jgi:hypothetical protein